MNLQLVGYETNAGVRYRLDQNQHRAWAKVLIRGLTLEKARRVVLDFEFGVPLVARADAPGTAEPWGELDEGDMEVEVAPMYGKLLAGASVAVKVTVTPHVAGRLDVAVPCCCAGGIDGGVLLRVAADVAGYVVVASVRPQPIKLVLV